VRVIIEKVSKTYMDAAGENTEALRDINLCNEENEFLVVVGPSGCGKSTLLNIVAGLLPATSGRVVFDGIPDNSRPHTAVVFQEFALFPWRTVERNVVYGPEERGLSRQERQELTRHYIELVGLTGFEKKYPHQLSGGMKQRVSIARALANDPWLLLMDEPFGAIDPINREQIQDEFLKLQSKIKKTVAFVSHDIHEAIKMGDKIALFNEGKLIQYDAPEIILTRPKNKFVADFVGADRALKVLGLIRVSDVINLKPKNIIRGTDAAPDALKFLEKKNFRYGIVIDGSKPIGYVTAKTLKYEEGLVRDVVEEYPHFEEEGSSLRDVLSYMLMYNIMTFCVVDENGDFIGTISYNDIQKSVRESYSDEAERNEEGV